MNELAQAQVAPQMTAPATTGQELAQPQEQPPQLPAPLDAVATGQTPATVLPPVQPDQPPDAVQQFVISNFDNLQAMGLGAFEAPDMSTVIFNPQLVDQASLEKAAQEGTLEQLLSAPAQGQELAPQQQASAGADATAALVAKRHAEQRPEMPVPTAPQIAPKVPASTQNMLAKARVRNLGAGAKPAGLTPNPVSGQLSKRAL